MNWVQLKDGTWINLNRVTKIIEISGYYYLYDGLSHASNSICVSIEEGGKIIKEIRAEQDRHE